MIIMRVKPNLFPAVLWLLFALGGIRADTGPVPGYAFAESVIQMNLEDVLTIVVDRNRDIQRSDIDVDTAALSVDNAEQQYHPSLSVIGGASSRWSDAGSENDGSLRGGDTTESVSARLNASYTVFDGFSRSSTLASNRELLTASRLARGRSQETVLWQVADAFLDAAAAGARIRVQEENLRAQDELLDRVEAFYNSGKRPVADLYQQQAERASAEYDLISATHTSELLKLNLLEIMDLPPDTLITLSTESAAGIIRQRLPIPESVADSMAAAAENRTDVLAARANLRAADASIRAARSGYWPTVSLNTEAGTSYSSSMTASFNDQIGSDNPYASLGVSISLPLMDRHATRNAVAVAELQERRLALAIRDIEDQVISDIRRAFLEYQTAEEQRASAEKKVIYARQALESFEQRYVVNAATLLEVIQARAVLLSAQYDTISAETNLLKKHVALAYSQGTLGNIIAGEDARKGEPLVKQ